MRRDINGSVTFVVINDPFKRKVLEYTNNESLSLAEQQIDISWNLVFRKNPRQWKNDCFHFSVKIHLFNSKSMGWVGEVKNHPKSVLYFHPRSPFIVFAGEVDREIGLRPGNIKVVEVRTQIDCPSLLRCDIWPPPSDRVRSNLGWIGYLPTSLLSVWISPTRWSNICEIRQLLANGPLPAAHYQRHCQ